MPPRLSVIIPVFNAAPTVGRTLVSLSHIAESNRLHVQPVVVNDGSTDESPRIIGGARERMPAFDWAILDQGNGGLSQARNTALGAANGEWIWFLDADDELLLDPLPLLPVAPEPTCVGFALEYHRHDRPFRRVRPRLVKPETHMDVFSAENPFQPSALLFRRSAVTHLFDPTIEVVNDWLFWMQNPGVFRGMEIRPNRCIARIHIHGRNMSRSFGAAGRNRAEVARRMLSSGEQVLSTRQRNNFFIQQQIGLMQQNEPYSPRVFMTWPCDTTLYAKALAYAAAARLNLRATPY